MSKVSMKHIFICGMLEDRKGILELLQRKGVVEIERDTEDDGYLKSEDVLSEKVSFDKKASISAQALEILNEYAPDTDGGIFKSLEGAKDINIKEYEDRVKKADEAYGIAERITALEKAIAEAKADIPKCETKIETLKPWMSFDLPLDFSGTKNSAAFVGSLPEKRELSDMYAELSEKLGDAEGLDISVISQSDDMTCIFVVCLKEDKEKAEEALKQMNFSKAQLSKTVPAREAQELKEQIDEDDKKIRSCIEEIKSYSRNRESLKFVEDYYTARADKYEVLNGLKQSKRTFFVKGFVPSRFADNLKAMIEGKFDALVTVTDPSEDEEVPVELRNGVFADPMESVVESYSMPGKSEIDPSKIMALFYYVFFGMMLSDAGYGLLLVIGTATVLIKCKNIKPSMKKMMKLFFYCGISTTVWGFLFGSFFGDAVNVIASTFFGRPDIKLSPIWFEPVSTPMKLLVFAFGIGILHIFVGLGIKLYECIRSKQYKEAIYDVVFWYMLVGGGIVYLLSMSMITGMLSLTFTFSASVGSAAAVVAAIGFVGIVLTGGRESKNWVKRLLKGAYSAYGVTSYLSDILSYSRLLALGLATGVIAQVFNKMGSMLGNTWYGIIIFIIVFMIGHVMNLAINVLGAYVHTNRLQYVEFFGKFYDGGGKKFEPFKENTKYYKVKEDD